MSNNMVPPKKGHRITRSVALLSTATLPHNPQNPHHLNSQNQALNSQAEMGSSPQPSTPPRTPRRNDHNQAPIQKAQQTPGAPETGSKRKPRNARPKNVNTSPAVMRNARSSPPASGAQSAGLPLSTKPISTPTTAAFAGPTFHASPAPSALPIPSFYSKSVPESPGFKNLKSIKKDVTFTPKTISPVSRAEEHREESPLDFFFKKDREEKERARSASSSQAAPTGPFPPPARGNQTPPASSNQNSARRTVNRNSSGGIFAMELDGENPGAPIGPSFSTPYSQRINAARSISYDGSPSPHDMPPQTSNSEALKAYLFSGHTIPSSTVSSPGIEKQSNPLTQASASAYRQPAVPTGPRYPGPSARISNYGQNGRSSGLRQEVRSTPTKTPDRNTHYATSPTPVRNTNSNSPYTNNHTGQSTAQATLPTPASLGGVTSGNKGNDLDGMTDRLRGMLGVKLDLTQHTSANQQSAESIRQLLNMESTRSGPVLGNLPAAAQSVPNYVGGRQPPLNGMHNGVMGS